MQPTVLHKSSRLHITNPDPSPNCPCSFRPTKGGHLQADEANKLAAFDFVLNDRDNGGYREIQLPCGRTVEDWPPVQQQMMSLYEVSQQYIG